MARLLMIGADNDSWGTLLNEFLRISHDEDGTLRGAVGCVATIDALKNLTTKSDQCIFVEGYYNPGDGGGGLFYWDATAVEPDNTGVIIVPSANPPTGRWKRVVDGKVSVKWFGAKGDGTADDTAALNHALAFILKMRSDYTIYFPAGKYRFASRPNSFPIGIKLVGNGPVGSSELGTLLVSDYDEPDAEAAFLCWDGSEAFHGTGGGLQDIAILKGYGRMGGNGVKLLGTDVDHRCGFWEGRNLMISGLSYDKPAQGAWHRCLLVDGSAVTNAGSLGVRSTSLSWWNFSKGTIAVAELRGATHFFATNGQIYEAGVSPARFLVTGKAGVNQQSVDVHFANCSFWGNLDFDYADTFTVSGGLASIITATPNAKNGLVHTISSNVDNKGTDIKIVTPWVGA